MPGQSNAFGLIALELGTAGIGQLQGQQILPVDPSPNRLGCLPVAIAGLAVETSHWDAVTPLGWGLLVYSIVGQFCIAYVAWFAALARLPASVAAIGTMAVPVIGVVTSAIALHEPLGGGPALISTLAGVVLATMLVPVGIAYAVASGLPGIYGLYATIVPLLVYALFSPSRILVLGPDSALAGILLGVVVPLAGGDPVRAATLAATMAIVAGMVCIQNIQRQAGNPSQNSLVELPAVAASA